MMSSSTSIPDEMDIDLMLPSTAEETAAHQPASMVVGTDKEDGSAQLVFASQPLLPGRPPPTNTDIFRRLQNVPVISENHVGTINTFNKSSDEEDNNVEGRNPIQNQNQDLMSPLVPVSEIGSNVPYSQQCTEDTDSSVNYVEGLHWSKDRCIGRGASGSCYTAEDIETRSVMVVKQISIEYSNEEDVDSEVNIMNSVCRHPNIISFLGATSDHYNRNIFMEWMKGGSIETKLQRDGPFDEDTIWKYSRQIISGLKFLHDRGIAHRDLKGANILLDTNHRIIRIADFGSAARLTKAQGKFHKMAGTPPFMAPEVVRASVVAGYGLKCDIWSLGCVLIEMSTTKPPWVPVNGGYFKWEILYKIGSSDTPPPLPNFHSTGLKDLAIRCLQVNPNNRPTSLELHH